MTTTDALLVGSAVDVAVIVAVPGPSARTLLSMRPKTVAKHLERVFEKLGVETRTAAARRAFEHLF